MTNKKTIADLYNEILNDYNLTDEHKDFIKDRLVKHTSKNSNSKPTEEQENNKLIINDIINLLAAGGTFTATEISNELGLSSNQKATSLLNKIIKFNARGDIINEDSHILWKVEKGKKRFYYDNGEEE